MKAEIRKILIKHGYVKQKTVGSIIIYLKKADDRYSFGFKYDKHQVDGVPLVSYGILDHNMFEIINAVELSPPVGIHTFTYGFPLNYRYFENGQFDNCKLSGTINLILEKIIEFNEKEYDLISNYVNYLTKLEGTLLLSNNTKGNQMDVLFEYYSLLFRICNSEVITKEDVERVITKFRKVDVNGFLKYRLELLIEWLGKKDSIYRASYN